MKRTFAAILYAMLALVVLDVVGLAQATAFPVTVSGVNVAGNKEIRAEEILKAASIKPGQVVSESDLKRAAQAVFDLGWFSEVVPEVDGAGTVLIRVVENPVVEKIEVSGNVNKEPFELLGITLLRTEIMSTDRIRGILRDNGVKTKQILSNASLKSGLEAVVKAYEDKGYTLIMVGNVEPGKTLKIEIIEGRVTENVVSGLVTVPESVPRALINLPIGECMKKAKLQEVVARLQASVYFSGVDIVPQQGTTPDSVRLVWTLTERMLLSTATGIAGIDLEGVTIFPKEIATASLKRLPQGPVTNFQLLESLEGLFNLYYQAGYVMVRFSNQGLDGGRIRVRVEEGLIGKIALKGNGSTKDYVILKNLEFKQGQVLSRDRLVVSYQALMALGYFKSVDLVPEWMGDQIAVSVSVVEEKNLGGINGSIAYSPESGGVVGKLDYKQKNLFGTGQDLSLSYSRGLLEDESAVWDLGYSTVSFFPSFRRVGFDVYRKTQQVTVVGEDKIEKEETFTTVGGSGSVSYPWSDYTALALTYKHEAVQAGSTPVWSSLDSLIAALRYDDVNNPRFPTTGSRRAISVEKAGGFAPGIEFAKIDLNWIFFSTLRVDLPFLAERSQVAAIRLSCGFGVDLPFSQLYDFGGPTTIRGVDTSSVQRFCLMNLEYRVALVEGLTATLFFDGGVDLDHVNAEGTKTAVGLELGIEAAGMYLRLDMCWQLGTGMSLVPRFEFGFSPMF